MENSELLFTSASVLELLANIDELRDKDIDLEETDSGVIISIGDSTYTVKDNKATEIEVDEDVVDVVDEVTSEAFDEIETSQDIEGGPIKELAKTLLIGGMVRLSAKLLRK